MAEDYAIFDRVWRVVLENDGRRLELYRDGVDIISGLRIEFDVQKGRALEPNTCNLKIYGLGDSDREFAMRRRMVLELYAGYKQDGARMLYRGTVLWGSISRPGADWVVSLECIDGHCPNPVAVKFGAGTAQKEVLDGLRQLLPGADGRVGGVEKGPIKDQPTGFLDKARIFVGTGKAVLEMWSKENNLATSIQDGRLISHAEDSDTGEPIIDVGPDTGLEGSPTRTRAGIGNQIFAAPGVELSCRLRGDLTMGRRIRVSSEIFGGTKEKPGARECTVIKISHTGDSWGANWTTRLEAWYAD